jgi:hypothetical protein
VWDIRCRVQGVGCGVPGTGCWDVSVEEGMKRDAGGGCRVKGEEGVGCRVRASISSDRE